MVWWPKVQQNPIITLTSDFGLDDPFVGMMKGTIHSISSKVRIVDITHGILAHDVIQAALVIQSSYSHFPKGSIHVVVVDPGVVSARHPLLAITEKGYFVGPDNGVFSAIYKNCDQIEFIKLTTPEYFQHPISQTFHGRDIFGPVAAWLSQGLDPKKLGQFMTKPVKLPLPSPRIIPGTDKVEGTILYSDRFGNILTNIPYTEFKQSFCKRDFRLVINGHLIDKMYPSYTAAKQKEIFAIWGSFGLLEIACYQESAASVLNVKPYDNFEIKINVFEKSK